MTAVRMALGAWGETVASRYLTAGGLRVLERNWRCRAGELDIVAEDRELLVFCEQKLQDLRQVNLRSGSGLTAK